MSNIKVKSNAAEAAKTQEAAVKQAEPMHDKPVFIPATDVNELDNAIIVTSDMPGVKPESLDVTLEDDVLTISGVQEEQPMEGFEIAHKGYSTGVFRRSFTIMADIDHDHIKATLRDGVLRLELPKAEKAKPRRIAVQAA